MWLRLAAGLCAQECAHATSVAPLQLLRTCEHPFIIDIAASSVAHYGPVEVLCLPVGRLPDDETTEPLTHTARLPFEQGRRRGETQGHDAKSSRKAEQLLPGR